jgi:hypothetical protein
MDTKPSVGERMMRLVQGSDDDLRAVERRDPALPPDVVDLTEAREAASGADPDVIALPAPVSEDGCGPDGWCPVCREEIRQEALAWIRDLNATASPFGGPIPEVRRITGDLWSAPS